MHAFTLRRPHIVPVLIAVALAFAGTPAAPAAAQLKPTLEPEDYAKWENLGSATLSPDGKWLAYAITRVDGDDEVRLRAIPTAGDSRREGAAPAAGDSTRVLELGRNPAFSEDGRWLAYTIGVAEDEREALEEADEPVRSKLALIELANGDSVVIDDIPSFSFSGDGRYLAMSGYSPEGRESKGVDVIVRDLGAGTQTTFGNVASFAWQDEGDLLALAIDAEGKLGNGVQLYDASTGTLRTLDSDTATYTGLEWRDESSDLAVLKVRPDDDYEEPNHVVLAWSGLGGDEPAMHVLDPAAMPAFPSDTRIVEHRELEWSEDGATVFFGIQPWEPKEESDDTTDVADADSADADTTDTDTPPDDDEDDAEDDDGADDDEKAGVEIWHARDVDIIPEQKVRAERDRERNLLTAWHLADDRIVEIGTELTETVALVDGVALSFVTDRTPYEREGMFGPRYSDLYLADTRTGERTKVKERVQFEYGLSPAGKYVLYLEDDHYWVYDVARAMHTNITRDIPTSFVDLEDDHTVEQKPPFGIGGWTADDRSVLLYDKYDVWEVSPDGSNIDRLSDGATDSVRHRIVRLDIDEDVIDPSEPVYVALYGERTKKYGYGTIERGERPQRLVFLDKNITRLEKAEDADVYVYQVQDFADSPDYFAGGADLAAAQVSETNPFQSDYAWGRSELIDFENTHGKPLQGALFYPANYEAGKKYPMIVYIYELTSQTVHNYWEPSERSAYNPTVWTQNGYFVFRPDIVYRDRNPGLSAVEALVPAVDAAVATGMIDAAKIGLIGHSWGGYQTAFVPTQTDIFAAAVAGAPLTELYTMYLSIYWNTGGTDARIFEISQGRMEVPPWQDLESYLANSPVHHIRNLDTPMLVTFGDEDGAVDWHQGIVMYNAARRANKELVMLVYEGENHGLSEEPNQIDYHRRVMDWFDHYLKGEPAPPWITEGVKFLDQDEETRETVTPEPEDR